MTFTVRLSQASSQPVTVYYSTADDTATGAIAAAPGVDYVTKNGTLTFAPGVTTQTIVVDIVGDILDENTETFFINLSDAVGAGIQDPRAVGTIVDNDGPLHLAADPNTASQAGDDLTEALLAPVAEAAIQYWAREGASPESLKALEDLEIRIEDLGGALLGQTEGSVIRLDDDAAGYGWSVNLTAVDSNEVDLFSVVVHEFGHVIGLEHDVMHATLAVGERDLPAIAPLSEGSVVTEPATASVVYWPDAQESARTKARSASLFSTPIEWSVETAAPAQLFSDRDTLLKSRLSRFFSRWLR
jgi:hypothetical protein